MSDKSVAWIIKQNNTVIKVTFTSGWPWVRETATGKVLADGCNGNENGYVPLEPSDQVVITNRGAQFTPKGTIVGEVTIGRPERTFGQREIRLPVGNFQFPYKIYFVRLKEGMKFEDGSDTAALFAQDDTQAYKQILGVLAPNGYDGEDLEVLRAEGVAELHVGLRKLI